MLLLNDDKTAMKKMTGKQSFKKAKPGNNNPVIDVGRSKMTIDRLAPVGATFKMTVGRFAPVSAIFKTTVGKVAPVSATFKTAVGRLAPVGATFKITVGKLAPVSASLKTAVEHIVAHNKFLFPQKIQ